MSALYAPLIVLACGWCVAAIREPPSHGSSRVDGHERLTLRDAFTAVRTNRPFAILLASYTVNALGSVSRTHPTALPPEMFVAVKVTFVATPCITDEGVALIVQPPDPALA